MKGSETLHICGNSPAAFAYAATERFGRRDAVYEIVRGIAEFHQMKRQLCGRFHNRKQERQCRRECRQHVMDSMGIGLLTPLLLLRFVLLIVTLVRLYREWITGNFAAYQATMDSSQQVYECPRQ